MQQQNLRRMHEKINGRYVMLQASHDVVIFPKDHCMPKRKSNQFGVYVSFDKHEKESH